MVTTTCVRKQMLRIAVFAALGAMSAVACAQSAEYRRGYDQGYRDGMEAQSHTDQSGGPVGRIIIEEANYGSRDGGFCHPRDVIQRVAGWRRHIEITANNELCGDPAQGRQKHLEIRYRCGDGPSARAEAPENGMISISCQ